MTILKHFLILRTLIIHNECPHNEEFTNTQEFHSSEDFCSTEECANDAGLPIIILQNLLTLKTVAMLRVSIMNEW